jgi:16S rRNA (guanine(966)-N(2))-methyltransferase RsmD
MSNPRIISGSARGIRLQPVPGDTTRPVTDRVKEAVFNIIGGDIFESNWLDLFGGTGSIGIEALSRGASNVTFIEMASQAVTTIKANLKTTRLEAGAKVIQSDAFRYLNSPIPSQAYDYVYIAPPQYKGMWLQALKIIDSNPVWLVDDGWVIVQIHPVEFEEIELKNLIEIDRRKYGSTMILIYTPSAGQNV